MGKTITIVRLPECKACKASARSFRLVSTPGVSLPTAMLLWTCECGGSPGWVPMNVDGLTTDPAAQEEISA